MFQDSGFDTQQPMVAGLSFKAIVELIQTNNEAGLRSFLETQHAQVDDRNEVSDVTKLPRKKSIQLTCGTLFLKFLYF